MTASISKLLHSWLFIDLSEHHYTALTSKFNNFFNRSSTVLNNVINSLKMGFSLKSDYFKIWTLTSLIFMEEFQEDGYDIDLKVDISYPKQIHFASLPICIWGRYLNPQTSKLSQVNFLFWMWYNMKTFITHVCPFILWKFHIHGSCKFLNQLNMVWSL